MGLIVALFYLVGLSVYIIKREYVLFYYLVWVTFFPYAMSFVIFDPELVKFISGQSNYFLALIFIINSIRFNNFLYSIKGLLLLGIIITLLLVSSLVNSVPFSNYLHFSISFLLPIYFISAILQTYKPIKLNGFVSFLMVLAFFEVALCFVQFYFFLGISPVWLLGVGTFADSNFMWGTFSNGNIASYFISLSYLVMMCLYSKDWQPIRKAMFVVLTIGVWWCILFSGIRTYLLLLFLATLFVLYVKMRNKTIVIVFSAVAVALALSLFLVDDYEFMASAEKEGGINRQIYGLSRMAHRDSDDNSTISLTESVLNDYFDPLDVFGKGRLYKQGYGRISLDDNNTTDATLAVYLVEFGVITLLLIIIYIFYQSTIVPRGKNRKKIILGVMLFGYCLISTITDPGIFVSWALLLLAFYNKLENNQNNNQITVLQ